MMGNPRAKDRHPNPQEREALMITYTILGPAYYNYSIISPETLFQLLRPLYKALNPEP